MDVGNPSNFERINDFFGSTWNQALLNHIKSASISDASTLRAIKTFNKEYSYLLDPHGAVGYASYETLAKKDGLYCILETAHPAKFDYIYQEHLNLDINIPKTLQEFSFKEKHSILIKPELKYLKDSLLKLLTSSTWNN